MNESEREDEQEDDENKNLTEREQDDTLKRISTFNMINTNAHSITPKIECFIEYLDELNSSLAFLTETWLSDSLDLQKDIEELETATGYSLLCKNRPVNTRGYSTGGVAIAYQKSHISVRWKSEEPAQQCIAEPRREMHRYVTWSRHACLSLIHI